MCNLNAVNDFLCSTFPSPIYPFFGFFAQTHPFWTHSQSLTSPASNNDEQIQCTDKLWQQKFVPIYSNLYNFPWNRIGWKHIGKCWTPAKFTANKAWTILQCSVAPCFALNKSVWWDFKFIWCDVRYVFHEYHSNSSFLGDIFLFCHRHPHTITSQLICNGNAKIDYDNCLTLPIIC